MTRTIKLWYSSASGCSVCGAKNKGLLAAPGFLQPLQCGPCLYVGGFYDPPVSNYRLYQALGWLESSREAYREMNLRLVC